MATKKDLVREALEAGKSITSLDALELFGTMRLADLIFKLKAEGLAIQTELIDAKDRVGNDCRVARYTLAVRAPETRSHNDYKPASQLDIFPVNPIAGYLRHG